MGIARLGNNKITSLNCLQLSLASMYLLQHILQTNLLLFLAFAISFSINSSLLKSIIVLRSNFRSANRADTRFGLQDLDYIEKEMLAI